MPDINSTGIRINGGDEITAEEAAQHVRNYTPSVQETIEEVADEPDDKTPISESERKSLDERQASAFQSPLDDGAEVRERAERFQVPGEWVPPYVRQRRQREMMLPNAKAVHDLEARLAEIAKHDGAPKPVAEAVAVAREALEAVRVAYIEGAHPDNRRFARDQAAKDDVTVKVAGATKAVAAAEAVAQRGDLQDEWFDSLAGGIEEKRAAALEALRAAEKAYASLRGSIGSAKSLAIQQGRFDSAWHSSVVNDLDLNRVLGGLKEAIAFIDPDSDQSDDYTTGRFLTAEYDEGSLPPHTLARLRRMGELSGSGSFPWQLAARALSASKEDHALQEALATKRLVVFMNSNPFRPRKDDIAGGIG